MTGRRSHRRRFLAGVAAVSGAAVAGCSALPWREDTGPTFTAADAATIVVDSTPPIEWPVPVSPSPDAVENGLERVDDLLADVPDPLDPETVPNGEVRKAISDGRDDAREHRDDAAQSTGKERYHALHTTIDAREAARTAATTFAAIDDDELVADVIDDRDAVRSRILDRIKAVEYRGDDDDLLRVALLYACLESDLQHVRGRLETPSWDLDWSNSVIEIGTGAGTVEAGAATTAVWDHLVERHEARIDESADVTSAFDDALEASIDRVDAADFPAEFDYDWIDGIAGDLDDQLTYVLLQMGTQVSRARTRLREAGVDQRLGIGLSEAVQFEQGYRAFERVRDRIEDGTVSVPETVDEIRAERAAAIDAATSAQKSVTEPSLGRYVLAGTLQSLEWTDDTVRRAADNDADTTVSLVDRYGDYVWQRAQFDVLSEAVSAFRERLRSA